MTAETSRNPHPNVERIFGTDEPSAVSDELRALTATLTSVCPRESIIKFEYDGTLRLHLDVRRFEELAAMELLLPTICGGAFRDVQRGLSERHSFFHRLVAVVAR
jgi:hypothetical protein